MGTMTTSWLDLMGDDSNISMASLASVETSNHKFDPEFDSSQQGVNLLFKKNIKLISDDSQSRKRRFQQIKSNDKENNNYLPPKAKQRTNANGDWKKRKNKNDKNNENGKSDFSQFLNWAQSDNKMALNTKLNDNKRNIINNNYIDNNKSNLIICGPSINNQKRKQYRGRRTKKGKNDQTPNTMTKIEEDEHPQNIHDDIDIDIVDINHDDVEQKEDDEVDQKEDEDDDLNVSISNKKRRITPTLENVVFNRDLILNKVPILKKRFK